LGTGRWMIMPVTLGSAFMDYFVGFVSLHLILPRFGGVALFVCDQAMHYCGITVPPVPPVFHRFYLSPIVLNTDFLRSL
jgi:hypothetical protein